MANKYLDSEGLRVLWEQTDNIFVRQTSLDKMMCRAYYLNGKFYTDSTYTKEVEKNEHYFYIDKNGNNNTVYTYEDGTYSPVIADATGTRKGIMKLFSTHGQNEDGTMTQKSITDGVNAIKFAVDAQDSECLVLDLPWD